MKTNKNKSYSEMTREQKIELILESKTNGSCYEDDCIKKLHIMFLIPIPKKKKLKKK